MIEVRYNEDCYDAINRQTKSSFEIILQNILYIPYNVLTFTIKIPRESSQ